MVTQAAFPHAAERRSGAVPLAPAPVAVRQLDAPPRSGLAQQPVYALLVQFPAVCFTGAWIADLAYWRTTLYIWQTFSVWLLAAGCVAAALAAVAGLLTWILHAPVRAPRFAAAHAGTSAVALAVSVLNLLVHSRDGYTAVVPGGIALSSVALLLMLLAIWCGWPRTAPVRGGSQ
ncbi:Uncharacterized membrane protein [Duganella sacchari]|uniref:Uncharacterized membrane protein n=1 Tax=Duganella sacchari TaxID=551987 RepID=A0A1M7NNT8_9BURK|nr:DUF2231 domain-containing protein [Duganella sacchari]SHN05575.1 Uncharacterized membrane protein [Duganella sacchari]